MPKSQSAPEFMQPLFLMLRVPMYIIYMRYQRLLRLRLRKPAYPVQVAMKLKKNPFLLLLRNTCSAQVAKKFQRLYQL